MSTNDDKASSAAPEEPQSDSVYDFLYHDARRIGSFLAQFDESGHLQEVRQSESVKKENRRGFKVAAGASVPLVASGNVTLERSPHEGGSESSERIYDPLWANALTLLDFLSGRELIQRDFQKARIGQFVLVTGNLSIMDLSLFKGLWSEPAVRKVMLAGATGSAAPAPVVGNRQQRRSSAATPAKSSSALDGANAGIALIGMLPHPIQMQLTVSQSGNVVWGSLRADSLVVSGADLMLKHGPGVAGQWNVLGIVDAFPDADASGATTQSGVETIAAIAGLSGTPFGQMMATFIPILRPLLGRPFSAYGITPLMIFREVSA